MRDYLLDYSVAPGDRTVVVTNNDDGYRTAIALADAGWRFRRSLMRDLTRPET